MPPEVQLLIFPERRASPWHSDRLILGAAVILALYGFFLAERLPVNGGLGWDGLRYAAMARDIPGTVFGGRTQAYFVQRAFPPALVWGGLRVLGLPPSDPNIIEGFELLSVVSVLGTAWLWLRIANELDISLAGKWFGFSAMFLNFAVARQGFYYPVLADMTAFLLGAAMLYAHLKRRDVLLAVLVALAWFTWVQAAYVGAILLLFPRRDELSTRETIPGLHWLAALAAVVLACGLMAHGLTGSRGALLRLRPTWFALPLSIGVAVGWLIYGLASVLRGNVVFSPRHLAGRLRSLRPYLVLCLLLSLRLITQALASPRPVKSIELLTVVVGSGVMRPGLFLISHVLYFGPVVLCMILLWKPVVREVTTHGPGLPLAVAAGILFSLGSESRWLINFLPLLVPFVALAVDSLDWRPAQYAWFAGLSLFFSKLWLPLNLDCPSLYFLSQGPWMTNFAWAVQGAVVLATGFGLWRWCRPAFIPFAAAGRTERMPEPVSQAA